MSHPVSPLAPATLAELPPIEGVRIATAEAGIKYKNRTDLMMMVFDAPTAVAGVLTRSRCPSAPVDFCRANLAGGSARALVVNSGNANAFTGRRGRESTAMTAEAAAKAVGCSPSEVFLASTGVIGEPLDAGRFTHLLQSLADTGEADRWREAAQAIMTTDTYPKVATRSAALGDGTVTINGIAKGAGMIAPDMATMLSFLATDAPIAAPVLQALLKAAVEPSFNSVTVDSDTSTSDTLLFFATGAAAARGCPEITDAADPRLGALRSALGELLLDLARQVARDGEGVRKEIQVTVEGAVSDLSAKRIALSIANSPLVKTAVAGEDANWGRVVMAVGKAGEEADRDRLAIHFGDVRVAVDGERDPAYSEAAASAVMRRAEILIRVDLGLGTGRWTVYGCDLTKDYVAINGDYRS
ncbi:bifunctional glutamate N-acetyltransferase/amino-acid acetyltransferase ArgJ [Jiella sp. MQZ9-1]|uniref:Arginine biosynthesis bifunctional protein ArgJ n=1 Tax=Jiella flava TaxID=2816857 RepID=A0A939JW56_9HYPH|nr:bifunctional glutamate N-acetyltransferase/amino-acid acetyltransferase ArgJ [Jiella flava]MBO0661956.1 bifunctional glutamate N-acetyltransferase/amino-acid acetyltransferase ArgJ [Jiella flava]MCD2470717.1 bifunctional glutamate N-acetyltransferase/amino-acid acetyltransferase ArgJ [Jiella flava]